MPRKATPVKIESDNKSGRIDREKRILSPFYKDLEEPRKTLASRLIDRAAVLMVMIEDLESYLLEHGYTESYNNGAAQSGNKQSSEFQAFTAASKQYLSTIDKLKSMIPDRSRAEQADELAQYLMKKPVIR